MPSGGRAEIAGPAALSRVPGGTEADPQPRRHLPRQGGEAPPPTGGRIRWLTPTGLRMALPGLETLRVQAAPVAVGLGRSTAGAGRPVGHDLPVAVVAEGIRQAGGAGQLGRRRCHRAGRAGCRPPAHRWCSCWPIVTPESARNSPRESPQPDNLNDLLSLKRSGDLLETTGRRSHDEFSTWPRPPARHHLHRKGSATDHQIGRDALPSLRPTSEVLARPAGVAGAHRRRQR